MSENHFFSMSRHCSRQGEKLFMCIFGHQTPIVVVEIAAMIVPPRWLWDVLVFQGRPCCSRHQNSTFCASIRFEITPNVHHHLYCCSQKGAFSMSWIQILRHLLVPEQDLNLVVQDWNQIQTSSHLVSFPRQCEMLPLYLFLFLNIIAYFMIVFSSAFIFSYPKLNYMPSLQGSTLRKLFKKQQK